VEASVGRQGTPGMEWQGAPGLSPGDEPNSKVAIQTRAESNEVEAYEKRFGIFSSDVNMV
jgi:hypothetical protein